MRNLILVVLALASTLAVFGYRPAKAASPLFEDTLLPCDSCSNQVIIAAGEPHTIATFQSQASAEAVLNDDQALANAENRWIGTQAPDVHCGYCPVDSGRCTRSVQHDPITADSGYVDLVDNGAGIYTLVATFEVPIAVWVCCGDCQS